MQIDQEAYDQIVALLADAEELPEGNSSRDAMEEAAANIGSRNWTALVRVADGVHDDRRLRWRTSTGDRPTDEWLAVHGYYGLIDNGPPEIDEAIQYVNADAEFSFNHEHKTATQTYTVDSRPREELDRAIDAERDARIADGFFFEGVLFQARDQDQKRISGAGALAFAAIMAGAQPGNLRWHGGDEDFAWIAADNSLVTMDAQTMLAFGQAAAAWESAHVFAARTLKDIDPIPADFRADARWPALPEGGGE